MAAAGAGAATADDPAGDAVSDDLATVPDKSRSVINGPVARMQARSMTLRSSRTLPSHGFVTSSRSAAGVKAAPDHAAQLEPLCQLTFSRQETAPLVDLVAHRRQQPSELRQIERLGEIVHRPQLDGFDRRIDAGVAGHQSDLTVGIGLADGADDIEAADFRHLQVDEHQFGATLLQELDGLPAVRAGDDVVPLTLRQAADERQDGLVVINSQQQGALGRHGLKAPHPNPLPHGGRGSPKGG